MHDVVVTGGTRGLGLAIASRLAGDGYRVIAVARSQNEQFDLALQRANEANAGSLVFRPFDLSDIDAIPGFVASLAREFGPFHGLVNNAGLGTSGVLATLHDSKIERLLRLNVASPIAMTKYMVRAMMARGSGRIHQGGADRIHALAGARGRAAGHYRELRGAWVYSNRHDRRDERQAACPDRAPQRLAPPGRGRRCCIGRCIFTKRRRTQYYRHDSDG